MDFVRAQNRARDAVRSSGQAVPHPSDSNTGIEHYHTPSRASGIGVSAVSRSSGRDMADVFTPSDLLDWLARWEATFEYSFLMMWDLKAADRNLGRDGLSPGLRKRLERSRRSDTPKETVPLGIEADDAQSFCHPQNLSSEWEEERRSPDLLVLTPEFPSPETSRSSKSIEEGSGGGTVCARIFWYGHDRRPH
eukprot:6177668-Pleurochrysis_carterae.AAC.1